LPPAVAKVDRDQPRPHPGVPRRGSGLSL